MVCHRSEGLEKVLTNLTISEIYFFAAAFKYSCVFGWPISYNVC